MTAVSLASSPVAVVQPSCMAIGLLRPVRACSSFGKCTAFVFLLSSLLLSTTIMMTMIIPTSIRLFIGSVAHCYCSRILP